MIFQAGIYAKGTAKIFEHVRIFCLHTFELQAAEKFFYLHYCLLFTFSKVIFLFLSSVIYTHTQQMYVHCTMYILFRHTY
jgi:hypothetical protein